MPRRKKLPKIPDYSGVPVSEKKLVVQKSNPLQTLSETDMTLSEFKLLDAYLSRIDSHHPEKRYVRFEKGDLERILGVDRIRKDDLSKRLDHLFQVVTIQDETKNNGFIKIALFEKAEVYQDDEFLWQIDLACTQAAMEYVFNIDNMGYLSYMLKNIVGLTSRYSYVLYLYLEKNRHRGSWKIGIDELKKMLNCKAERYEQYKFFNSEILKKCHSELSEKTTLKFHYEPADRKRRKFTSIIFTIDNDNSLSDGEEAVATVEEDDFWEPSPELLPPVDISYGGELADMLGEIACDNEFSPEQIRVLQDIILELYPYPTSNDDRCDYLTHQVHTMNLYDKKERESNGRGIIDRFAYLRSMLKNDLEEKRRREQKAE